MVKFKKKTSEKLLGQILLERGAILEIDLQKALRIQKKDPKKYAYLGDILLACGLVHEDAVIEAFLSQYSYPFIPVESYVVGSDALHAIPKAMVRRYRILPLERGFRTLTLAMSNPLHREALETVARHCQCPVMPCIARPSELDKMIQLHYGRGEMP